MIETGVNASAVTLRLINPFANYSAEQSVAVVAAVVFCPVTIVLWRPVPNSANSAYVVFNASAAAVASGAVMAPPIYYGRLIKAITSGDATLLSLGIASYTLEYIDVLAVTTQTPTDGPASTLARVDSDDTGGVTSLSSAALAGIGIAIAVVLIAGCAIAWCRYKGIVKQRHEHELEVQHREMERRAAVRGGPVPSSARPGRDSDDDDGNEEFGARRAVNFALPKPSVLEEPEIGGRSRQYAAPAEGAGGSAEGTNAASSPHVDDGRYSPVGDAGTTTTEEDPAAALDAYMRQYDRERPKGPAVVVPPGGRTVIPPVNSDDDDEVAV